MKRYDRRRFLEDSMLATAAAVTAGTAPLLADDAPSTSPGEKLAVASIGVRGRGASHLRFFAGRPDTEVVAICDVDSQVGAQRAAQIAERQGRAPKVVRDMRKLFDDQSIDIITVATPNHWHALAAVWALQAGKDVYLEKPVSHNVREGRSIVQAARKYRRICQTGTQSRSNPGMQQAIEYVRSGKIGDIAVARGLCYKPRGPIGKRGNYPIPPQVDYDLWLGPAPKAPLTRPRLHYDWHWQWPYGNGDLGNQGIHQMDIARWGLGADGLSHGTLSYGGRLGYEDAGDTANTQVVIHDYGNQTLVFEVRGLKTGPLTRSGSGVVFAEKKYHPKIGVIFEGSDGYVAIATYHSGAAFDLQGRLVKEFGGHGSDANHFMNFLKAVRSRKPEDLNADIEQGHISSALCHLGNISYRLGNQAKAKEVLRAVASFPSKDHNADTLERTLEHLKANGLDLDQLTLSSGAPIRFDPNKETIVDNEAARAMLTRNYRKPFVVPAPDAV